MDNEKMELVDPNPDIYALFCHYNSLYFDDALGACTVAWSSARMTRCAGVCRYQPGGGCEIRLSEPLLKFRSTADLKNTLLHEMIHALLWIKNRNKDHSDHGPSFQGLMTAINCSHLIDHQKPAGGYNITIFHEFQEEVDSYKVHQWICDGCGDLIKRAINREPSVSDCIEHVRRTGSCGNPSCHWHKHRALCSSSYKKIAEPPGYKDKRIRSKGKEELHNGKSDGPLRTMDISHELHEANKPGSKTIANVFPSANGVKNTASVYPCEAMKCTDIVRSALAPEIPQRRRLPEFRKRRNYPLSKRRKVEKHNKDCLVVMPWLGYYGYEETDEEIEPLINKRTERRKREQMLKNQIGIEPKIELSSYHNNNSHWRPCTMLDSKAIDTGTMQESGGIKLDANDCFVAEAADYYARYQSVAKHQALEHLTEECFNQFASKSNSRDMDDIIYISD